MIPPYIAPPHIRPPPDGMLQVYVGLAQKDTKRTWSLVAIKDGDGWRDWGGSVAFEAGGGEIHRTPLAVTVAQEINRLLNTRMAAPAVIRAPDEILQTLAGLTMQPDTFHKIRSQWDRIQKRAPLWLMGSKINQGWPWADRAQAIADLCLPNKAFGEAGPLWAGQTRAEYPAAADCSICMEDFDDTLPSGSWLSPALQGRFDCTHTLCRKCDARIQRQGLVGLRCPLCRQPRKLWTPMLP